MDNLAFYNQARSVPANAQKPITGGRLNGMTDINPMWRIKQLTEMFGPCGIGWKLEIAKEWLEKGSDGNVSAFMTINLYIKQDGEWSDAIPGTGGSAFIAKERSGLYTSDECFKMAMTDAISVACKLLGFGADVYWEKDKTKYTQPTQEPSEPEPVKPQNNGKLPLITREQRLELIKMAVEKWGEGKAQARFVEYSKYEKDIPASEFETVKKRLEDAPPF